MAEDEVVALPDDVDPSAYVVIERDLYEKERSDRESAHRLIGIAMLVLGVALIVATAFGVYDRIEANRLEEKRSARSEDVLAEVGRVNTSLSDLSEVVEAVRRATSPEAQAAQAERLAGAITELDCRNREALQELADALADAGSSVAVTIRCAPE
jgi:hypothetical protein